MLDRGGLQPAVQLGRRLSQAGRGHRSTDALERAVRTEIKGQDGCYGVKGVRRFMSTTDWDVPSAERLSLRRRWRTWAADGVRAGEVA